jgi:activator of HSP90 ATPase
MSPSSGFVVGSRALSGCFGANWATCGDHVLGGEQKRNVDEVRGLPKSGDNQIQPVNAMSLVSSVSFSTAGSSTGAGATGETVTAD